jgi:transcriptional regulator with XRE-family HTH domain
MITLKELRQARSLTQAEVASRIGVGQQFYSRLENGGYDLTADRARLVARALKYRGDPQELQDGQRFMKATAKIRAVVPELEGVLTKAATSATVDDALGVLRAAAKEHVPGGKAARTVLEAVVEAVEAGAAAFKSEGEARRDGDGGFREVRDAAGRRIRSDGDGGFREARRDAYGRRIRSDGDGGFR